MEGEPVAAPPRQTTRVCTPMGALKFRRLACGVITLGVLSTGFVAAPSAQADGAGFHILSAQDLCNLIWPSSVAMPDPAKFGAVCVRNGGLLLRLARALPATFSNTFTLAPGNAPELPIGSVPVDPKDPVSAWIIPDCHVPGRLDCT